MVANLEVERKTESVIHVVRRATNAEIAHNETMEEGKTLLEYMYISIVLFSVTISLTLS